MEPSIKTLPEKKLVGKSVRMSLANDKTAELWRSFMPRRKAIKNGIGLDLYSVQVYDESWNFRGFNPQVEFAKCAMIEVPDFDDVPKDMETRVLKGGLYAVFVHQGTLEEFPQDSAVYFWAMATQFRLRSRPKGAF